MPANPRWKGPVSAALFQKDIKTDDVFLEMMSNEIQTQRQGGNEWETSGDISFSIQDVAIPQH